MIIEDDIISVEKQFLSEILYNWEAILAWDFYKIGKVRNKTSTLIKNSNY